MKAIIIIIIVLLVLFWLYLLCLRCRRGKMDQAYFRQWRYAHRGLHDREKGIPENSMAAFKRAAANGFGAELDVHLMKDGKLAVIHDASLLRTAGADVEIEDLTAEALEQYPLEGTEQRIPLLEEVLPLFTDRAPLIVELKAEREEMELASERKRQSVLRMELEWAKRGCRARSTKQRARLERLEALKNGKAPVRDANVELDSVETRMGKKTIELHHISKSFGEKKILDDFNYIVLRNQRLGIIGPNGCGKSTLIKIIDGVVQPDAGEVEIGETIRIGYFAQEVPDMDTNQRVIDYIRDVAEYIPTRDGKISATMMLERFLFDSAMQYAPIAKLSGGEKRRLYLLKVLMEAPNVLLLDEPSNDLDIPTLTILEDYLDSFAGIVIAVSHDRYFLDNIVDRIFAFEGNGHLTQYEGGYTDYTEALARKGVTVSDGSGAAVDVEKKKAAQSDWKQNRPQKLKFTYKEQREFETIDDDIAALEELLEKLDKDMEANATNSVKLREIMEQKEKAQADLDEKMDRWVYLNDLAERIEAQKSEK